MWLLKLASEPPREAPWRERGRNTPASKIVFNAVHSRMVHSVQWLIGPLEPQNPERTRHAEIKDCIRGQYLCQSRMDDRRNCGNTDSIVWLLFSTELYNRHERQ